MVFLKPAHVLIVLIDNVIIGIAILLLLLLQCIGKFGSRVAFTHRFHKGLVFLVTPEIVPL